MENKFIYVRKNTYHDDEYSVRKFIRFEGNYIVTSSLIFLEEKFDQYQLIKRGDFNLEQPPRYTEWLNSKSEVVSYEDIKKKYSKDEITIRQSQRLINTSQSNLGCLRWRR